jgi:hypothetical protein
MDESDLELQSLRSALLDSLRDSSVVKKADSTFNNVDQNKLNLQILECDTTSTGPGFGGEPKCRTI